MNELTNVLRTVGERLPALIETNFGLLQVCDLAADRIEKLEAQLDEARELMRKIQNEAVGMASFPGVREIVGNTNVACVNERGAKVIEFLARTQSTSNCDATPIERGR